MAILVTIRVVTTLMAPFGMKMLLQSVPFSTVYYTVVNLFFRYLETRGDGAVVRPWVWITYLFFGPALGTIAFQWYIYITVSSRLNIGVLLLTRTLFFLLPSRPVPWCASRLSSRSSSLSTLCAFG
jgi:hypothetical protein